MVKRTMFGCCGRRLLEAKMLLMKSLAASLSEYPIVMGMFGVGPALGPQLMAEIGNVRRFHAPKALVAFAGIDAPPYRSGQMNVRRAADPRLEMLLCAERCFW